MQMKNVIVSLVAVAGVASAVNAQTQPPMEPVGATFKYEVALPGGAWGSSVDILPGQRVEWRAVVTYTGSETNAAGLGQVYYQPIFNNVDNAGANQDNLGTWRNNGISGQGNTTLQQGLLSVAEGADSSTLASYGRVRYGFTSRSTTAGSSGGLTGIRHSGGSAGAPAGEFLRIAGSGNPNWYPANIPNGTVDLNNQILWGVVSDNNTATSTWYTAGTQNVVIFRQAFIASADDSVRSLTLTSESATLRRAGGGAGTDDTRSMLWARTGEAGSTGTIRVGVQYIPATINIIPTPGAAALLGLGGLVAARRRRA
jgi:uncharacterized protein (TIGR03382 family)